MSLTGDEYGFLEGPNRIKLSVTGRNEQESESSGASGGPFGPLAADRCGSVRLVANQTLSALLSLFSVKNALFSQQSGLEAKWALE